MKVVLITGPMFSGKTKKIIKKANKKEAKGQKSIVIKHVIDTRNNRNNLVSSHDGLTIEAISTNKLCDISDTLKEYNNVFIDEGQFFKDLYTFTCSMSDDVNIYIGGLDYDYLRKEFKPIADVRTLATKIITISSVCYNCDGVARFSKLLCEPADSENNIIIGGSDKYVPVCGDC